VHNGLLPIQVDNALITCLRLKKPSKAHYEHSHKLLRQIVGDRTVDEVLTLVGRTEIGDRDLKNLFNKYTEILWVSK
jgi:hypothetical protein